ncbi:MAG: hypothetical protein E7585_02555 [Ruminococcaceae bacterium]|nr:hypothetical protein [Oscillospiraceae bacterium]
MKTLGNIIWILICGLQMALLLFLLGCIWCITIIGIPFGLQAFKMARLVLAPFGLQVNSDFLAHPIANLIWFVFGGWVMALEFAFVGILLCVTIIGIPFGKQFFKMAVLVAFPFGASVG